MVNGFGCNLVEFEDVVLDLGCGRGTALPEECLDFVSDAGFASRSFWLVVAEVQASFSQGVYMGPAYEMWSRRLMMAQMEDWSTDTC